MALQDSDGNEVDGSFLRWGPCGELGMDELERAIDEELAGHREHGVDLTLEDDGRTLACLWYDEAPPDVVARLAERGALCADNRFTEEASALMARHPAARVDALVQCIPAGGRWLCVVRRVDVYADDEATDEDVACAQDLARTFMGRDADGCWRSQSVSVLWFEKGVNARCYDWRGDTPDELVRAHEMDLPARTGV